MLMAERPYTGKVISEYIDTMEVPGPDGATFTYTGPVEDRGSFVTVSDTHVLTNWHVVHSYNFHKGLGQHAKITLVFSDGSTRSATVAKIDPIKDLALLEFTDVLKKPLHRIGIAKTFEPEKLTMGGYQEGVTYEEASADSFELIGPDWFTFDVLAIEGQSGSPIIDENGLLVGLLWGSDYPTEEVAYGVHVDSIRDFLRGTGILELKGN